MSKAEVTTNEIMYFLEKNMVTRDEFYDFKQTDFKDLRDEVQELSGRVDHIENQMVTKDYLDDKFADFGAEIGKKINKQAEGHEALLDILVKKSVLQEADVEQLKK